MNTPPATADPVAGGAFSFPHQETGTPMKSICVYCGSNAGSKPAYTERAIALGDRIARDGLRLVYGGGNVGLMGTVANAVLAAGGEVTGVIPRQLADWEVAHRGLTELEIVGSMHERKSRMFDLADGFVALPGGFGTMEEIFEMLTWRQLGIGNKPCAFLDVDGFYAPLIGMIDRMVEERFLHPDQRQDLWYGSDIEEMLAWMQNYQPAQASKWIDEKRRAALR
jgi:uncharacterized protein (TIGR00730 family)